jgi:hypothetical protein
LAYFKRDFAKKGKTLAITDTLNCSRGFAPPAHLITHNVKDFPMQDLSLYPLAIVS